MPQAKTIYICTNCHAQAPKWAGRCSECGAWGSYREDVEAAATSKATREAARLPAAEVIDMASIAQTALQRLPTGLSECDRVLGGGIVAGSLILLGGEPGIGKSTLALQIAAALPDTLYVSGEESPQQIKSRFVRFVSLGFKTQANSPAIQLVSETNVERVIATIIKLKPPLVIIDSIQTITSHDVESESGSLNQIRAGAVKLLQTAKEHNIPIIITGHITKDGTLAGPKTLEHLVDVVLYLEQNRRNDFHVLRAVKNRFGSVDEIGLFTMTGAGFSEVKNPSGVFLDELQSASGTAVSCIMEGTRPFLLEVQALVTKTAFGYPQRKAGGFDLNRLQILLAVLQKRAGLNLMTQDVHINIVGGLKVNETALDLAVCAAVVSSLANQIIPRDTVILGEVGLGGEVRKVSRLEQRLSEAHNLHFKKALVPASSSDGSAGGPSSDVKSKLEVVKICSVGDLVSYITK